MRPNPDIDYRAVDEAAIFIGEILHKYSAITVLQVKEKYGEARIYCTEPYNFYNRLIYRLAYRLAIRKWPHLRGNILEGADWYEHLEGL
jgi:hypothetical protein